MPEHECSKGQAERCHSSKSPNCTCACGGWNHGNQAARRKAEAREAAAPIGVGEEDWTEAEDE